MRPTGRPTPERRTAGAGPLRTCIGCRACAPQPELVRIARRPDGVVTIDRHAPGRGAWICRADAVRCLHEAVRRRAFPRAFRAAVDMSSVDALAGAFGQMSHDVADLNATGWTDGTIRKG